MFKNPMLAKIMYFFRILPMVRQRDGLRNVLQNNKTQEIIVDTLEWSWYKEQSTHLPCTPETLIFVKLLYHISENISIVCSFITDRVFSP